MKKTIIGSALLLMLLLMRVPAYAENGSASYAPKINVYLSNAETGSGNANPGAVTSINARVVYEGCTLGYEYILVLRIEDTSTGAICTFSDGNSILRYPFVAEGRAGVFEFEFNIDAAHFSGRTLSEIHYLEGMEAAYAGTESDNSGHIYVPKVVSNAVSETGEKTVLAGESTVICDVVSYYGLAVGEEYRLVTGLKDSRTGKVICSSDGNPVSASSKFTPAEPNGQIATKITVDLRKYANRNVSLFEDIYIISKTGIPIALLSNQNDSAEDRTVFAKLSEICVLDRLYGTPISGVSLQVTSLADNTVFEGESSESGKCKFALDANERYVCNIISVPEEYNTSDGPAEFTAVYSEEEAVLYIRLLKKNTVVLTRTDAESGKPVQGMTIEVRNSAGRCISSVNTDELGMAYFDANAYWDKAAEEAARRGEDSFILTFYFKDTSTPSEYYPREDIWSVSIDENRNITGLTELLSYKRYPLTITVVDMDGSGIPGVELSLIYQDGSVCGRAVTDHDGRIFFTPKRTGKFVIVEDKVPAGYTQLLSRKQFSVEEDGTVSGGLTITNLSEDFTSSAVTVFALTAIVLDAAIAARFLIKRALRKKARSGAADTDK